MINNTITDNTGKAAGAVWNRESDLVIINSILWGNYGDKQVSGMSAYSLDIAFSNVQDGWNGGSNISIDPKLIHVERTPGDTVFYCLDEASPCIDTGPDTSFFFDNENKFRPGSTLWPAMNSLRNDMGAYGGKRTYDIEDLPIVVDWVLDIPGNATQLPLSYKLNQNYPNPFNPVTAIGYQLSAISDVELSIYNVLGQKIVTLVSERQSAGPHQVEWDASMMASGIYYYKIEAGEFLQVRKMILIR